MLTGELRNSDAWPEQQQLRSPVPLSITILQLATVFRPSLELPRYMILEITAHI